MTEHEWLAATDPTPVLEFLKGKASDRKLRLFAVACCHRIESFITDPGSRFMVNMTERAADGPIDTEEILSLDYDRLTDDCGGPEEVNRTAFMVAGHVGYSLVAPLHGSHYPSDAFEDAVGTANGAAEVMAVSFEMPDDKSAQFYSSEKLLAVYRQHRADEQAAHRERRATERLMQVGLLRCILGNPFRPILADPSWLTSDVVALANGIYEERAFDRMPILADALQDAGCNNEDILDHCRGPSPSRPLSRAEPGERDERPHVRGCWVVDLVLGKE